MFVVGFLLVAEQQSSTGLITGVSVAGAVCLALLLLTSLLIRRHRRELNLWWAKRAGKNKGTERQNGKF